MNALYISYDGILDPLGGSQVMPYLEGLSKDINFSLLTFEKKHKLKNSPGPGSIKDTFSSKGISWEYLIYHKRPSIPATLFDIFSGVVKSISLLRSRGVGVVHARGYISACIALFLKKTYKTKFIFDMRGLWPDEKVDAGSWKKSDLTYKVFKYLEKLFFRYCDWVVVLSQKGKLLLEKAYPFVNGKISFIPTCVDLDLFDYRSIKPAPEGFIKKNHDFIFLYNGSLGSWYMLEEMIDFFLASIGYYKNPLFIFLNESEGPLIESRMRAKGIGPEAYSVKFFKRQSLSAWIRSADACLFFIRPVFSKIVSCPTKFAEALACGVPVVINSGIGDTEDIVKDNKVGVVCEAFSRRSYEQAIAGLSALISEGQKLKERCRQVSQKYFSLKDGVKEYLDIYQKI
ncbi:MAG: glycosyltransferase [Candidatus Omnitrophica bacterium]|nr:glycosyltransferase [Candidatus Omnitrophota bacterium]